MIQFLRVVEKYQNSSGEWQTRCLYRDTETGEEFGGFLTSQKDPAASDTNARVVRRLEKLQVVRGRIAEEKADIAQMPERAPKPVVLIPEGER